VRQSDYDYMNSRLADNQRVEAEFDCKNTFVKGPVPVYDTIAEIKGTTWPDEVVIISAHTDSWNGPGSQGCTDNGTGTVVTLEAARILAAVKAKPKRTIRFILWTGEEQGLLGSQAYVQSLKPEELSKISAVFVDDGGTDYEGGLNAIGSMVPYLAAATAPVNGVFYSDVDKKWLDVNIKHQKRFFQEAASDNASFNMAGVPGFFWDEVGRAKYNFGWHTQNDKLDLAIPEYLVQSSTNAAVVAYQLACAPRLLPRATDTSEADEKAPATPTRRNGQDPGQQAPAGK
jgi:Zn-dependent M28 family amino/carboxypeptidase